MGLITDVTATVIAVDFISDDKSSHSIAFWLFMPLWGPFWLTWQVVKIAFLAVLSPFLLPIWLIRRSKNKATTGQETNEG